jgi:hypothetical protein
MTYEERTQALAIVMQMSASHPMLPDDREHREITTRQTIGHRRASDAWTLVEFRPARWLLTALTVLALWLVSPTLGKRGLLGLAWQFAPRRLRLIAGGVATLVLVVLAGSVAALAVALTQLA